MSEITHSPSCVPYLSTSATSSSLSRISTSAVQRVMNGCRSRLTIIVRFSKSLTTRLLIKKQTNINRFCFCSVTLIKFNQQNHSLSKKVFVVVRAVGWGAKGGGELLRILSSARIGSSSANGGSLSAFSSVLMPSDQTSQRT